MHSNYRLDHHCMNDYYVAMVSQRQSWYRLGGIMFAISAICYVYDHVSLAANNIFWRCIHPHEVSMDTINNCHTIIYEVAHRIIFTN